MLTGPAGDRRRGGREMPQKLSPDPDLDALVQRLNDDARQVSETADEAGIERSGAATRPGPRWSLPRPQPEAFARLDELLGAARGAGASDVLLVAGTRPTTRVDGKLQPLADEPLTLREVGLLCGVLVPDARREEAGRLGAIDFSLHHATNGNLRCNVHRQRAGWAAAVRLLPPAVPALDELGLPPDLARFAELQHGLVLVTGPTGCGKSTTLAAIVGELLARRTAHLITVEDPVEYVHEHGESVVEHVEIGRDVDSYATALRSAMRQDPDVLLIGEMRDTASMSVAITAAETGHLVFSTLHTGDAAQTIHRILDSFPPNQVDSVRAQLSVSLAGIVSQQLLPRVDGPGRVPAVEILIATRAVRNLIRKGEVERLRAQITLERQAGMLELDRSLVRLVRQELVDEDEARGRSRVPELFEELLGARRSAR